MITVPIHEGKARGRRQLSLDNPDVTMVQLIYTIVAIRSANWFPGSKEKSSDGMMSYPEEI